MSTAPGKFMVFRLGREEFGVPILGVRELLAPLDITRIPRSAPAVRGIVNLRGRIVPVVDLRQLLGMPPLVRDEHTVIVVVSLPGAAGEPCAGFLVDEVLEVVALSDTQLEPPPAPAVGMDFDPARLAAVGKPKGRIVFLLDLERLLSTSDASASPR